MVAACGSTSCKQRPTPSAFWSDSTSHLQQTTFPSKRSGIVSVILFWIAAGLASTFSTVEEESPIFQQSSVLTPNHFFVLNLPTTPVPCPTKLRSSQPTTKISPPLVPCKQTIIPADGILNRQLALSDNPAALSS